MICRSLASGVVVGMMLFMGMASIAVVSGSSARVYAEGECEGKTGPEKEDCEAAAAAASGGGGGAAVDSACDGVEALGATCGGGGDAQAVISGPIKSIIRLISFAVGVACVLMIIYGAFKFITSGGNSDSTKDARNTILYALVGLILVLTVNILISFVFDQAKELNSGGSSGTSTTPCVDTDPNTPGDQC